MAKSKRDSGRDVPCPRCGAMDGQPCRGARGSARKAVHLERLAAGLALSRAMKGRA